MSFRQHQHGASIDPTRERLQWAEHVLGVHVRLVAVRQPDEIRTEQEVVHRVRQDHREEGEREDDGARRPLEEGQASEIDDLLAEAEDEDFVPGEYPHFSHISVSRPLLYHYGLVDTAGISVLEQDIAATIELDSIVLGNQWASIALAPSNLPIPEPSTDLILVAGALLLSSKRWRSWL